MKKKLADEIGKAYVRLHCSHSENKGNLISRQAVKDIILGGVSTDTDVDKEYVCGLIDNLPPVENKGEWVHILDSYYEDGRERESHWECSKCGSSRSGWGEFKFCPDCGADMREPKGEKGTE